MPVWCWLAWGTSVEVLDVLLADVLRRSSVLQRLDVRAAGSAGAQASSPTCEPLHELDSFIQ